MTREGPQGETRALAGRIAHLCSIASLSRASYYRWLEPKLSARDDADLRDPIQRLALRRRHEGYRRITRRLRDEGLVVNAKRVLRLMRADNLLSLRKAPVRPADQIRGNKNVGFSFHVFGFSFPLTLLLLPEILEILPPREVLPARRFGRWRASVAARPIPR